jgi:hypothetical protein
MDFQYSRSAIQSFTYDITINVRSEGPTLFVYDAMVKREGGNRGKQISGKVLRATDPNKAAAEARNQITRQIDAFDWEDE